MISIVLDKNIDSNFLMNEINKLISSFKEHSPDLTPILCISIKQVAYDTTSLIGKLEYKQD